MSRAPQLSAKDVRLLVKDLETGRGQAGVVAARNPWLIHESAARLRRLCGEQFPVFRTLTTPEGGEIRPEDIVSTTLRPTYALKLGLDAPGMVFTHSGALSMDPTLLRYDLSAERVVLYIPYVIELLRERHDKLLRRMVVEARGGERLKGLEVVEIVERLNEQEVIMDVEGLTPKRMEMPQHVAGRSAWYGIWRDEPASELPYELSVTLRRDYLRFAKGACIP